MCGALRHVTAGTQLQKSKLMNGKKLKIKIDFTELGSLLSLHQAQENQTWAHLRCSVYFSDNIMQKIRWFVLPNPH